MATPTMIRRVRRESSSDDQSQGLVLILAGRLDRLCSGSAHSSVRCDWSANPCVPDLAQHTDEHRHDEPQHDGARHGALPG